ncbi:unnamed protein product [Cylicostephanus goldi]|uniref:G-protein coupled receptors family 1 profile domain-containing protein n=1 Tax=Cylicostephanus goldi TaxID=71465 RepID=A0A3P6QI05_CYLGO|nr:unnamed protein product [Cylicostephanus goldi]
MEVHFPLFYQIYYIVIPSISVIGNSCIVYITIRSKALRSPCNIFIALVSLGVVGHIMANINMSLTYLVYPNHVITRESCILWQLVPVFGMCFSTLFHLIVAIDSMTVCLINASMDDATKKLLMNGVVAIYVMTVICYALFLRRVRKVSISEEHMRGIYRSLILVTAAIALSFVSFAVVNVVLSVLQINMDELNRTWLTGTFLNLSTAANFFIYYFNRFMT